MELLQLRDEIDRIDKDITALLVKRFELSRKIGDIKSGQNMPVEDTSREEIVMKNVTSGFNGTPAGESLINIFKYILSESKQYQRRNLK